MDGDSVTQDNPGERTLVPGDIDTLLIIHAEIDRRINYAMQQNDVPVVKALSIENRGPEPLHDLKVTITSEPDFASTWSATIATIPAESRYPVEGVDLSLSPALLGALTEATRGRLRISLNRDPGVTVVRDEAVELLAHDEWSGTASLPEILAAFVTPNHPALTETLRRAASLLQAKTGDSSLSGYQTKSVLADQALGRGVQRSSADGLLQVRGWHGAPEAFEGPARIDAH